jgi:hypothetical protein
MVAGWAGNCFEATLMLEACVPVPGHNSDSNADLKPVARGYSFWQQKGQSRVAFVCDNRRNGFGAVVHLIYSVQQRTDVEEREAEDQLGQGTNFRSEE